MPIKPKFFNGSRSLVLLLARFAVPALLQLSELPVETKLHCGFGALLGVFSFEELFWEAASL
jgi:hypothetical protein